MFRVVVSAATLWDILDSVSAFVDGCKIRLNEESLPIRAVDLANVGMADLMLNTTAFESHETHDGVIGVNLSRLEEVAGMAGAGDLIHSTFDKETCKPNIRIDRLSYTFTLIGPNSIRQELSIPDFDLAANIVLEGTHPDCGIKTADMALDRIRLRVDDAEETSHIEAEGGTDGADLSFPSADLISIEVGVADSLFSLDYLKDMNRAISTGAEVTVELGEEFPVKLHYQIAEGMDTITYMLVPRIQSDRVNVSAAVPLSGHRAIPLASLDSHWSATAPSDSSTTTTRSGRSTDPRVVAVDDALGQDGLSLPTVVYLVDMALLLDEPGGRRLLETATVPRAGVTGPADDAFACLGSRQVDHFVPRYHGGDDVVVTIGDAPVLVERPHRSPDWLRDFLSELPDGAQSGDARIRARHLLVALKSVRRGLLERLPLA